MSRFVYRIMILGCICALLTGCSAETAENTQLPAETTAETMVATEPVETIPATEETAPVTEETIPATEETEPATEETETVNEPTEETAAALSDNDPVMELPEAAEGPCHFFDDAAMMGDSISYSLMVHHTRTKDFGDAIFLVRGSLGLHNTLGGQLSVSYQGQSMTPWDALAASGVKKVFIMMGMNDIGYYGIDATMEKWVPFLENIRECCPDLEIYIQSMPPMWIPAEQPLLNNANIDAYNLRLQEFAEENDCRFIDIAPYFKNRNNGIAKCYTGDMYVHMNEAGTAAWATILKNYAENLEKELS